MKQLDESKQRRAAKPESTQDLSAGQRDLRLVRHALAGEPWAADELSNRLHCLGRMLRSLSNRLRAPLREADILDLAQETALALWRKLGQFDGRGSLETWAYRFCALQMLVHVRRASRRERLIEDQGSMGLEQESLAAWDPGDPTVDLEHALVILDPAELEVVRAKHYDELTFEAIGTRLGASPNSVKTRYYRALMKLREHLCGRYPELFGEREEGLEQ